MYLSPPLARSGVVRICLARVPGSQQVAPMSALALVGCLGLVVLVRVTLGLLLLVILACGEVEWCLGVYPVDCSGYRTPPECWDADDIALEMSDHPYVWTDGSREDFSSVGGFEVAGAGVYLPASEVPFESSVWGTAEECGDARLERCRAFLSVPGVMQTVQRLLLPYRRIGLVILPL